MTYVKNFFYSQSGNYSKNLSFVKCLKKNQKTLKKSKFFKYFPFAYKSLKFLCIIFCYDAECKKIMDIFNKITKTHFLFLESMNKN